MNITVKWSENVPAYENLFEVEDTAEVTIGPDAPERPIFNLERLINQTEIICPSREMTVTDISQIDDKVYIDYSTNIDGRDTAGLIVITNPQVNEPQYLSVVSSTAIGDYVCRYKVSKDLSLSLIKTETRYKHHEYPSFSNDYRGDGLVIDSIGSGEMSIKFKTNRGLISIELVCKDKDQSSINDALTLEQRNQLEEYLFGLNQNDAFTIVAQQIIDILKLSPENYSTIHITKSQEKFNVHSYRVDKIENGTLVIKDGAVVKISEENEDNETFTAYYPKEGTWTRSKDSLLIVYNGSTLLGYKDDKLVFRLPDVEPTSDYINSLIYKHPTLFPDEMFFAAADVDHLKMVLKKHFELK